MKLDQLQDVCMGDLQTYALINLVNERYLKDQTPLFEKGLQLLKEIVWNPLVNDNQFNENFVAQEKTLLAKKLELYG